MAEQNKSAVGGVKKWLYALMGKSVPQSQSVQSETTQQEAEPQEPQEDSVSGDIKMFKGLVKEGLGKAKVFMKPYAQKGTESVATTSETVKASVDNKFIKVVVRSFIVVFFVMILAFIASFLFKRLKEEGSTVNPENITVITPTPIAFEPYIPSVYAEDPEILNLEQQITILDGEIRGIIIKESGINPPSLDYDVSF